MSPTGYEYPPPHRGQGGGPSNMPTAHEHVQAAGQVGPTSEPLHAMVAAPVQLPSRHPLPHHVAAANELNGRGGAVWGVW
jgi:hypothetical protein